jgi:hypothetical protein
MASLDDPKEGDHQTSIDVPSPMNVAHYRGRHVLQEDSYRPSTRAALNRLDCRQISERTTYPQIYVKGIENVTVLL